MAIYQRVANHVQQQVERGVLQFGDKIPSVRKMSARFGCSISTVVQGYELLQSQQVIESRPQSGFYVRERIRQPDIPAITRPETFPGNVSSVALAMQIVRANEQPGAIQLGTAMPSTNFPAVRRLHQELARQARRLDGAGTGYDMPPGFYDLRLQLAKHVIDAGIAAAPDDIVVTTGCMEALALSLRAVTEPGDTVIVESPSYFGIIQAIESLSLKALEIPTDPKEGPGIEAVQLALEQWPVKACIFVTNFSNPLGACMPDERKQALMALLDEYDVPLIEDDVYGDLSYASHRPRAVKSLDSSGRVLYCSSLSKTLDPGLRIGWCIPGRYLEKVTHLKLVASVASATLPARAAAGYLESGGFERHIRAARAHYRSQKEQFLNLAAQILPSETRITSPQGGFLAWVELPEEVDSIKLYRRVLPRGVNMAPGPLFSPTKRYGNFIRVNYARVERDSMERALTIINQEIENARKNRPATACPEILEGKI